MLKNFGKKLFENIKRMKKGEKVDSSNPLFSLAQKIIQSKPPKAAINQEHKQNLKLKLEVELPVKGETKISGIPVFKRLFSFQPQNLIASGVLITMVCLVILFTGMPAGEKEAVRLPQAEKGSGQQEETAPMFKAPPAATSEKAMDEGVKKEETKKEEVKIEEGISMEEGARMDGAPESREQNKTVKAVLFVLVGAGVLTMGIGIRNLIAKKKKG